MNNCIGKIEGGQADLKDFLTSLSAYVDKQEDKTKFFQKLEDLAEEGITKKITDLFKDRANSMRETMNTQKTIFKNSLFFFRHNPETYEYGYSIKQLSNTKLTRPGLKEFMEKNRHSDPKFIEKEKGIEVSQTTFKESITNIRISRVWMQQETEDRVQKAKDDCMIKIYE